MYDKQNQKIRCYTITEHTMQCNRSNKLQGIAKYCLAKCISICLTSCLNCFRFAFDYSSKVYDEAASGSNRAALFGWRRLYYSCCYSCSCSSWDCNYTMPKSVHTEAAAVVELAV